MMKAFWVEPEIESLPVNETMNDLKLGADEDHMSWTHGFPAYECDCS